MGAAAMEMAGAAMKATSIATSMEMAAAEMTAAAMEEPASFLPGE